MDVDIWRLRIYVTGFLIVDALYIAVQVWGRGPAFGAIAVSAALAVLFGVWSGRNGWVRNGAIVAIATAVAVPVLEDAFGKSISVAVAVADAAVWPQLLLTLVGSRVLTVECELSFGDFWRKPARPLGAVEIQSIPAALALGAFLTLGFYLVVPHLVPLETGNPSAILVSAMQGGTIVHTMIVFLFFVIVAVIFDAARLYLADRAVLADFRRAMADPILDGAGHKLAALSQNLAVSPTRAARLLAEAIDIATGGRVAGAAPLQALSFDGFREASRRFVRALLPFLPLLGFLGTVIGLATAISELPHAISAGPGQSFDVSASLAGLAIKFETTLLGLMGSMISSLGLNLLEKREAEFAAECLLAVDAVMRARGSGPGAPDAG